MACSRGAIAIAVLLAAGCGDEVVGFFDASSSGTSDASLASDAASDASTTATSGTTQAGDTTTSAPGDTTTDTPTETGFMAPGCFGDDFEDGTIGEMWNTWAEQDSELVEVVGVLKMTPPSTGVWDTGVVGAFNYVFPFHDGHARVRVPLPPATSRPVLLWLSVNDELTGVSLAMHMANGVVTVLGNIGEVTQYREDFPMDPYPAWLQVRAEGAMAHFETSDDGVTFTTLTTRDKLAAFDSASGLLMAQTYGDDVDHSPMWVDDFEVCVQ
jgi:hypothetical protein